MKKLSIYFSLLIFVILISASGCYYDNFQEIHPQLNQNCDTNHVISYANDIVPMLANSCGTNNSCHGPTNTSSIDLTSYTEMNADALNGSLYSSIIWDGTNTPMPKGSSVQISVCSITKFKKWIDAGGPNN